jgi:Ser/Thr protein kinase RdoA (MazF antagonist)
MLFVSITPLVRSVAEIEREAQLLRDLSQHAALRVPIPLQAAKGEWWISVDDPPLIPSAHLMVFSWVKGKRIRSIRQSHIGDIGDFLGRFHAATRSFALASVPPAMFWDWQRVFGEPSVLHVRTFLPQLSAEDRTLFQRVGQAVREAMETLGRSHDVWGRIHSDLHSGNCVFTPDGVGVIDFEDCGIGYYLYDLAVVLDELLAKYPALAVEYQQELVLHYRRHHPLTREQEQLLPHMLGEELEHVRDRLPEVLAQGLSEIQAKTQPGMPDERAIMDGTNCYIMLQSSTPGLSPRRHVYCQRRLQALMLEPHLSD